MRIALLIAGHLRRYDTDNIRNNFLKYLHLSGQNTVDTFCTFWEFNADRYGGNLLQTDMIDTAPLYDVFNIQSLQIFPNERERFQNEFRSEMKHEYVSPETSGDAASMWWMLYLCKERLKYHSSIHGKYDLVIRLRSDIFFDREFNLLSTLSFNDEKNILYTPKWHGRYGSVCKELMDHLFWGSQEVIEKICNTFLFIPRYLNDHSIPHTSEAFMYRTIQNEQINISRIEVFYSLLRPEYREPVYL